LEGFELGADDGLSEREGLEDGVTLGTIDIDGLPLGFCEGLSE